MRTMERVEKAIVVLLRGLSVETMPYVIFNACATSQTDKPEYYNNQNTEQYLEKREICAALSLTEPAHKTSESQAARSCDASFHPQLYELAAVLGLHPWFCL